MPIDNAFYAGLATLAGPVIFYRSFRDLGMRRLIQNTPTARIRSMPMGLVEVNGVVEPRSVVTAPFSGRPCAYWEVDIATQTRRDAWTVVHRNASGRPFYLTDATGTAMVYPHGAQARVRHGVEEACPGLTLPECYAQYMADQRLAMRGLWRVGALRFRERLIEAGQQVYVLGTAVPRSQVFAVSDDDALQATGTDDPRGRRLQERDREVVAVIRQGEDRRAFLLSEESERELTLTLGLKSWAGLVGGPALALFGVGYWLYVLAARMGR